VRPNTRAAIVTNVYNSEITVGLRTDPRCFDTNTEQQFINVYLNQLNRTAEQSAKQIN
jgi:hypothetical protein